MGDRRRLRTLGQACTAFRRPCTHSMNVVSCGSGLHTADLWCSFPHLQQYVALRCASDQSVSGVCSDWGQSDSYIVSAA